MTKVAQKQKGLLAHHHSEFRKVMKTLKVKKADAETALLVAKEMGYDVGTASKKRIRRIRGKLLAALRYWDDE